MWPMSAKCMFGAYGETAVSIDTSPLIQNTYDWRRPEGSMADVLITTPRGRCRAILPSPRVRKRIQG